jgi:hypothetical protein
VGDRGGAAPCLPSDCRAAAIGQGDSKEPLVPQPRGRTEACDNKLHLPGTDHCLGLLLVLMAAMVALISSTLPSAAAARLISGRELLCAIVPAAIYYYVISAVTEA